MRKTSFYKCGACGFKTREANKKCPLCGFSMQKTDGELADGDFNLPEKLDSQQNRSVQTYYYCLKHGKMFTHVCLSCNDIGLYCIEYKGKVAFIEKITALSAVFSQEEIAEILRELSFTEKNYIYHNYAFAYRFFYKHDKVKAAICFMFACLFYFTLLGVTFNVKKFLIASYIFNALNNWLFSFLTILGIWYLFDASGVELKKTPLKMGICCAAIDIIYLLFVVFKGSTLKWALILGYLFIVFSGIFCLGYFLWVKRHEK